MSDVAVIQGERPRNVNAWQAAAILYGDWGTSKAYVVGLAFALAGNSSFWLILGICMLNVIVGINYIIICKYYPNGGGVYASVRHRSEVIALLGAFFLICDYIITSALSAFAAFSYAGVESPAYWAMLAIAGIGIVNYYGPRHTGNAAFVITIVAVFAVAGLAGLSFFYLDQAVANVEPLHGGVIANWENFVGVVVALSGVEAIANMTGVMKLDPGSTAAKPRVVRTATPAIIAVMVEVSVFTLLFSLAINALPGLTIHGQEVDAPGNPNVRDYMLRYMAEVFGTGVMGPFLGHLFSLVIAGVFIVLLISAVNTATIAYKSLFFVMARDGQVPRTFSKLNRFGVPHYGLLLATLAPILVLVFVNDLEVLAHLYAVGFVGAIATNLGSTSTDKTLPLANKERIFMFASFLIMTAIEITLFIEKPSARTFAVTVLALGLLLRGLVQEQRSRQKRKEVISHIKAPSAKIMETAAPIKAAVTNPPERPSVESEEHIHIGAILCAVTHIGKTLEFALRESRNTKQKLYILFIREQKVITEQNVDQSWLDDEEARKIFDYALDSLRKKLNFAFMYDISDQPSINIIEHAKRLKVSTVVLGTARRGRLLQLIRGNVVANVFRDLPSEIDLIIIS